MVAYGPRILILSLTTHINQVLSHSMMKTMVRFSAQSAIVSQSGEIVARQPIRLEYEILVKITRNPNP